MEGRWLHIHDAHANHDLWLQLQEILDQAGSDFHICWIPSHLDFLECEDDREEWIAVWNDLVDGHAVQTNMNRGPVFSELQHGALSYFEVWSNRIRELRKFYLAVAQQQPLTEEVIDLTIEDEDLLPPDYDGMLLTDAMPVDWRSQLNLSLSAVRLPLEFVSAVFEAIFTLEQTPEIRFPVSFIELTLWLISVANIHIPVWNSVSVGWDLKSYHGILLKPTFVSVLHQVKLAVNFGLQTLGFSDYSVKSLNRSSLGIHMPCDGIIVHTSHDIADQIKACTNSFTGSRAIRKVADLARPI